MVQTLARKRISKGWNRVALYDSQGGTHSALSNLLYALVALLVVFTLFGGVGVGEAHAACSTCSASATWKNCKTVTVHLGCVSNHSGSNSTGTHSIQTELTWANVLTAGNNKVTVKSWYWTRSNENDNHRTNTASTSNSKYVKSITCTTDEIIMEFFYKKVADTGVTLDLYVTFTVMPTSSSAPVLTMQKEGAEGVGIAYLFNCLGDGDDGHRVGANKATKYKGSHTEVLSGEEDAHSVCSVCANVLSTSHEYTSYKSGSISATCKAVSTHSHTKVCSCGWEKTVTNSTSVVRTAGTSNVVYTCTLCKATTALGHSTSTYTYVNSGSDTATSHFHTYTSVCSSCGQATSPAEGTQVEETWASKVKAATATQEETTETYCNIYSCTQCEGTYSVAHPSFSYAATSWDTTCKELKEHSHQKTCTGCGYAVELADLNNVKSTSGAEQTTYKCSICLGTDTAAHTASDPVYTAGSSSDTEHAHSYTISCAVCSTKTSSSGTLTETWAELLQSGAATKTFISSQSACYVYDCEACKGSYTCSSHVEENGGTLDCHSYCSACDAVLGDSSAHNFTECSSGNIYTFTCTCGYSYSQEGCQVNGCVAEITLNGSTSHYSSIEDAFSAVAAGVDTTIVLTADSSSSGGISIKRDYIITLDLNGYTISADVTDAGYFIFSYAELTIQDSAGGGAIAMETSALNAYGIETYSPGEFKMTGGLLSLSGDTVNAQVIFANSCDVFQLTGGTIVSVASTTSRNFAYAYGVYIQGTSGTIENVTISTSASGKNYGYGMGVHCAGSCDITISDTNISSEADSYAYAVQTNASSGVVKILDGVYSAVTSVEGGGAACIKNASSGTVQISGGVLTASSEVTNRNYICGVLNASSGTIDVTGGIIMPTGDGKYKYGIYNTSCAGKVLIDGVETRGTSVGTITTSSGGSLTVSGETCDIYWTHGTYTYTDTLAASCLEDGIRTYTCSTCGDSYTSAVSATGHSSVSGGTADAHTICSSCGTALSADHSFSSELTSEATCLNEGATTYSCSCGYEYSEAVGKDSANHESSTAYKLLSAATCTSEGEYAYAYTCCGAVESTGTIDAVGHKEEFVGSAEVHTQCSVCEAVLSIEHSFTESITTQPTCTQEGEKTFKCKCGYSYTELVEASGHTKVEVPGTKPTCTEEGVSDGWYCSVCGFEALGEKLAPTHSYVNTQRTEPSCTSAGYSKYVCSVCGDSYEETDPATGHVEAYGGTLAVHTLCEECGKTLSAEHAYAVTVLEEATSSTSGTLLYSCVCGYSYTETINPKHNHSYSTSTVVAYKAASWTADCQQISAHEHNKVTYITYTCSCGYSYTEESVGALESSISSISKSRSENGTTYTCSLCEASHLEGHPSSSVNYVAISCEMDSHTHTIQHICTVCAYTLEEGPFECEWDTEAYTDITTSTHNLVRKCTLCSGSVSSGNVAHEFGDDSVCKGCGYECTHEYEVTGTAYSQADNQSGFSTSYHSHKRCNTYTCSLCGNSYDESVKTISNVKWTSSVHTDATCSSYAYDTYYCADCKAVWVNYLESEGMLDHALSEVVKSEATCTNEGSKVISCANCTYSTTETLEALGHDWGDASYSWASDWASCVASRVCKRAGCGVEEKETVASSSVTVPATCISDGTVTYMADFEADWAQGQVEVVVLEATGKHDYVDGVCSECGAGSLLPFAGGAGSVPITAGGLALVAAVVCMRRRAVCSSTTTRRPTRRRRH